MQTTIVPDPPVTQATLLIIRFLSDSASDSKVLARFKDPRNVVAVGESIALESLATATSQLAQEVTPDCFEIITTAAEKLPSQTLRGWIGSEDLLSQDSLLNESLSQPIKIKIENGTVYFRPGRAVVHAPIEDSQAAIGALIDFAFYENELRKLERSILPFEATADADVELTYEMSAANRQHWKRLYRAIESLYRLRLQFARLEPHLDRPSPALPLAARRVFAKLASRAGVPDRLEALSNRLETCEDLYEGATDRITDFKAFRSGNLLEIAIVVLLVLEVVLLLVHGSR